MRPRLDDGAKKIIDMAEFGEMGPDNIESGMRAPLVVSPRRAAEIEEGVKWPTALDDNIGKINRPVLIAFAPGNRHCKQFDGALRHVRFVHVRKSAEPQDVDLAVIKQAFALLPWNAGDILRGNTDSIFDKTSDRLAETLAVFCHAGSKL